MHHKDLPVISFSTAEELDRWFSENHTQKTGFWLRFFKKGCPKPSVTYSESVDTAICWGWIDGLKNSYDEESYLIKFTPRRAKSIWSKINVAKVETLTAAGRMQPSGLKEVENAKKDGRWENAYEPQSKMTVPEEFIEKLKLHPEAYTFFLSLNKANLFAIGFRLTESNPEKKEKKMEQILEMMINGKKFH